MMVERKRQKMTIGHLEARAKFLRANAVKHPKGANLLLSAERYEAKALRKRRARMALAGGGCLMTSALFLAPAAAFGEVSARLALAAVAGPACIVLVLYAIAVFGGLAKEADARTVWRPEPEREVAAR